GELLILITNACPETALPDNARRWGIENLFGAMKTRGFCLESTHFKDPERLSRLLALRSLAFIAQERTHRTENGEDEMTKKNKKASPQY
ncbi:MAG: transposase, partial [Limnospira sp. PMC 1234.20]|uniref:transposase n=1 Tax=Limnospira sp. PMC 1234.20 TaxID=2981032 RepID=UPI0028E15199